MWSSVRARLAEQFKQGDHAIAAREAELVGQGRLALDAGLRHEARRPRRPARAARAPARRSSRAEGLFDAAPQEAASRSCPRVIGLITGRDSDAEKDVLRNARAALAAGASSARPTRRCRATARAPEVVAAIRRLDADPEVEVIIVARGGGDFQNLLGFSDERVVRAAAAASTPIVSAIGHEADRPLLDEVADLRASTPTDAAKRVVPDVAEELVRVEQARARLGMRLSSMLAPRDRPHRAPALAPGARRHRLDRRPPRRGAHPVGRARRRARRALHRAADRARRRAARTPARPLAAVDARPRLRDRAGRRRARARAGRRARPTAPRLTAHARRGRARAPSPRRSPSPDAGRRRGVGGAE